MIDQNVFEYTKVKEEEKRIHYGCHERRKNSCKVTACVTKEDGMVVRISGEHNHDSNIDMKVTKPIVKTAVMEAAKNLTVAPKTILQNVINEVMGAYSNDGVNTVLKQNTFNKMIQCERMMGFNFPPPPKTWDDMIVPDILNTTAKNEDFFITEHTLD